MHVSDWAPAAALGVFVTACLAGAQLLPFGNAIVLVRIAGDTPEAALEAAAATASALVSRPAPHLAVLSGDAGRIRATLGLAVIWRGSAPCSTGL